MLVLAHGRDELLALHNFCQRMQFCDIADQHFFELFLGHLTTFLQAILNIEEFKAWRNTTKGTPVLFFMAVTNPRSSKYAHI